MVRLREISRTAAFAWSPGATKPLIVTGTRAGAVDADFSDETKLELWDLSLDNHEQGLELQPIASIVADSRFFDIAWGLPTEDHPQGIIAGALENGSLDLWDAEKLIAGASDALIARTQKHTGAIKSLQFNPLRPQILASAGAKGELYIYDVNDPSNAFRLGTAAAHDLECVAWNVKVSHILATGGSGGFVTVWDLKTKKASLTLNNNRKAVSSIAWDPNNSTKLLTATHDDTSPVILLWDLRNSNAPERTLAGHEQGVLSVSWCQLDGELLLSCGKDNRTIVWNPQTGERYGEFPEMTNWTFLTRFHPHNPPLSATASFDGKITIQTLQNTNPSAPQTTAQTNLDGEDFFTQAQTQPQGAAFTLPKAPKWLERPVGVSFGFGGKLVVFRETPTQPGQHRSSKITISHFSVDSDIGSATEQFEEKLKAGDLAGICKEHKELAISEEEKADWTVIETLIAENTRKQVVSYLGFSDKEEEVANGTSGAAEETKEGLAEPEVLAETKGHKKNRLSTFFTEGVDTEGDDFLASLSATKGAKTDNPFQLFGEGDSAAEKRITRALMFGQFEKATSICLEEDRMADAFMIANCGGKELVDKVQSAYLSQKTGMPSYLRLLSSVIVKNLWDVVYNADLADWKETMVTLCTFAEPAELPDLCEALGDRILQSGARKDASFCFLVGHKLEKVVDIWIAELDEAEQAALKEANDSSFSIHARTLQHFIEKVTVFREVAKFQDTETGLGSGWKLASLYDKYTEYADIVAAHGQLGIAQKYLDLLPTAYPAAEVARNRVKLATQSSSRQQATVNARATPRVQPAGGYNAAQTAVGYQAPQPAVGYQPPQAAVGYQPPQAGVGYQPLQGRTGIAPAANPYQPAGGQTVAPNPYAVPNPYAPSGFQTPQPPQHNFASVGDGTSAAHAGGLPPHNFGPPLAGTPSNKLPASRAPLSSQGNWNDVPLVNKAPPPRRSTPSASSAASGYGAGNASMPPPSGPYGGGAHITQAPPPPRGPPIGRAMSPLGGGQPGQMAAPARPGSAAANAYAPPPAGTGLPSRGPTVPPSMANFASPSGSPYGAPPPGTPASSRYAPAAAAPSGQPPQQGGFAPPPGNRPQPQANQYAQAPQGPPVQAQYAPSPYQVPQQRGAPPTGPPPSSIGVPAPPPAAAPSPAPPRAGSIKARHAAGDRSHIPASAQQLVSILERDMQRVASKAPASFFPQVKDTQKRLGLLFDHLNNEEIVMGETIEQLTLLAIALDSKNYAEAQRLQVEIQKEKTEECGNWMVGVKRLVSMSKATA